MTIFTRNITVADPGRVLRVLKHPTRHGYLIIHNYMSECLSLLSRIIHNNLSMPVFGMCLVDHTYSGTDLISHRRSYAKL